MAAGKKEPVRTKDELVAALDRSRRSVSADLPALGHALNPFQRLKQSLASHPVLWLAGSMAAGLAGTRMISTSGRHPRPREVSKSLKFSLAPLLGLILRFAIAAARPAATRAVKDRVSKLLE